MAQQEIGYLLAQDCKIEPKSPLCEPCFTLFQRYLQAPLERTPPEEVEQELSDTNSFSSTEPNLNWFVLHESVSEVQGCAAVCSLCAMICKGWEMSDALPVDDSIYSQGLSDHQGTPIYIRSSRSELFPMVGRDGHGVPIFMYTCDSMHTFDQFDSF
jgi:hypothetical protein